MSSKIVNSDRFPEVVLTVEISHGGTAKLVEIYSRYTHWCNPIVTVACYKRSSVDEWGPWQYNNSSGGWNDVPPEHVAEAMHLACNFIVEYLQCEK